MAPQASQAQGGVSPAALRGLILILKLAGSQRPRPPQALAGAEQAPASGKVAVQLANGLARLGSDLKLFPQVKTGCSCLQRLLCHGQRQQPAAGLCGSSLPRSAR